MKAIASFFVVVALSGCASSSGALKMGPDTYSITATAAPARGGIAAAKRTAYEEASQECFKTGKEMLVINERSAQTSNAGGGSIDITFRCLPKGDPELAARPDYRTRPDVVIQDQRK